MKSIHFYSVSLLLFLCCFQATQTIDLIEKAKRGASKAVEKTKAITQKTVGFVKEKGEKAIQKVTGKTDPISFSQRDPKGCNGFLGLCSRRYNEVAYAHSHNATTQGPSIVNNQDISLNELLKRGVRSIKIPVHYARDMGNQKGEGVTVCHGIYRPTLYKNYYAAVQGVLLKKLMAFFDKIKPAMKVIGGAPVPGAYMKVRDIPHNIKMYIEGLEPVAQIVQRGLPIAYGKSSSPPEAKIPFTPCAIDPAARSLESVLKDIKMFLDNNPREVFTIILERTIPIDVIGIEFQRVGLDRYAHVQDKTKPWPTLQSMVESDKRLVVFDSSASEFPWILDKRDFFFGTPYAFSSKTALEKSTFFHQHNTNYLERQKDPKNKLFEISHFLTIGLAGVPGAADVVNKRDFIRKRVKTIGDKAVAFPNYISTDFTERPHGDVFDFIDEINGVGKYAGKPLFQLSK